MAIKNLEDIYRDIGNKIYSPIYLLQGEEPYYIDYLSDLIERSVLDEFEKEFNQTVVYGRDSEPLSLVSNLKRYPMMANYQVVILKEAQDMRAGLAAKAAEEKKDGKKENKSEPLLAYLEQPLQSTVLVICYKYKSIDKRSKIYKTIEKNGVVFDSKKIHESKLPEWIEKFLSRKKVKIDPRASQLMADHIGNNLSRIANECEKLSINVKQGEIINLNHIETNIGISKEFNVFELQDAIGKKDVLKANRIANYFRQNPKTSPMPVMIAFLYSYFAKLLLYQSLADQTPGNVASVLKINPFFVPQYSTAAKHYSMNKLQAIVGYLKETDLKSKGVNHAGNDSDDLLRELIFKIMH